MRRPSVSIAACRSTRPVGRHPPSGSWIRASQPLGVVVDQIGSNVLMSYSGLAAELCFVFNGQCVDNGGGSGVAYGPLIYREQQGWEQIAGIVDRVMRLAQEE